MTNVLAIEAAVDAGSISVIRSGIEVSSWIGESGVLRAEYLLGAIDETLSAAGISMSDVDMVAVSAGPGSFTGIRIGLATGLGLKAGSNASMSSISALRSMAAVSGSIGMVASAVPMGRETIAVQMFDTNTNAKPLSEPITVAESEFKSLVRSTENTTFLVHSALYDEVKMFSNVAQSGRNIAYAIGLTCIANPTIIEEPLFLSKTS